MQRFLRLLQWQCNRLLIALIPKRRRILTHDRFVLERRIFREIYLGGRYREILFAGCKEYTAWYPSLFEFFSAARFETIDADPESRRFGCRRHHTVGRLEDLAASHRLQEVYDLVILNGLFGYGTDDPDSIRKVVRAGEQLVRPGGSLLIGFNDLEGPSHFDPAWVSRDRFRPEKIPGLAVEDFLADGSHRHRFICFVKNG